MASLTRIEQLPGMDAADLNALGVDLHQVVAQQAGQPLPGLAIAPAHPAMQVLGQLDPLGDQGVAIGEAMEIVVLGRGSHIPRL